MRGGYKVQFLNRFLADYKRLPPDIQKLCDECLADFERDPLPEGRRPHPVTTGQKPKVFSMDLIGNKSWKLTFHFEGDVAVLRRVDTHAKIDKNP